MALGCYTETARTEGYKTLSDAIFLQIVDPTIETCQSACAGYKYFGVEYGGECYCGDIINKPSVLAPASECNVKCRGDESQTCGGGNRLNIYQWYVSISISLEHHMDFDLRSRRKCLINHFIKNLRLHC